MTSIRTATMRDVNGISGIWLDAWHNGFRGIVPDEAIDRRTEAGAMEYWTETLADVREAERVLVAEDPDGRIPGFAQIGIPENGTEIFGYDAELWKLYVWPSEHGRGIGRALMSGAADTVIRHGGQSMILRVLSGNRAVGFYSRLGGEVLGELPYSFLGVSVNSVIYGWKDLRLLASTNAPP